MSSTANRHSFFIACARNLEPTLPERKGWVDRTALGDIRGRSRKKQMELAGRFGIEEYAQPAGGCCFLTDARYSAKLRDLWAHRESRDYDLDDIMLLKVGRHIRPNARSKLIVARDAGETNFLSGYRNRFTHLMAESHDGPMVLIQGEPGDGDLETAARITARYGQGRDADRVAVRIRRTDGAEWLT